MLGPTREEYGARDKAEAKRTAKAIAAYHLGTFLLARMHVSLGEHHNIPASDIKRLGEALASLMRKLREQASEIERGQRALFPEK